MLLPAGAMLASLDDGDWYRYPPPVPETGCAKQEAGTREPAGKQYARQLDLLLMVFFIEHSFLLAAMALTGHLLPGDATGSPRDRCVAKQGARSSNARIKDSGYGGGWGRQAPEPAPASRAQACRDTAGEEVAEETKRGKYLPGM
ncbi:hypothetical protein ACU4GD_22610 [Cupriavidus basilensis]